MVQRMTKIACVFPGQGSQKPGMGKALAEAFPAAREVFEEIDETLGQHLTRLMFEGPESDLTRTENAQPAIMAVSLAACRVLEKEAHFKVAEKAALAAGHSLGEYSALTAAGALTLREATQLLRTRGRAMQEAVPEGIGAMAALLGLDVPTAEAIAKEAAQGEVCEVANDNAPGQVVISGHKAAVERAVELAKTKGAKRAVFLPVSAPFHCSLMQPAAETMQKALAASALKTPLIPIVANITAESVTAPETIRDLLVRQVTGRVRWTESMHYIKSQGISRIVEIGEGNVLSGLIKRIDKEIETLGIGKPEDIEALLSIA